MTSDSLAKLYAEVVKVRQEAAVVTKSGALEPFDTGERASDHKIIYWHWVTRQDGKPHRQYRAAHEVEAIILSRWLGMLPESFCLVHVSGRSANERWAVFDGTTYWYAPTPTEALAHYLKSTGTEDNR
jgi:hypothetical protein